MNHIDAVSKDITQLYQTIAHGFDLTQHYIMGRPMLKPTPRFLSAYHMNINLQVINLQLFAWQDTINKLQKIRDKLSLAVIIVFVEAAFITIHYRCQFLHYKTTVRASERRSEYQAWGESNCIRALYLTHLTLTKC